MISAAWLSAEAAESGLSWSPPSGMTQLVITRAEIASTRPTAASVMRVSATAPPAIRRGETVTLTYSTPGVQISARARALQDGAVGESIRLMNPQSQREIDAIVTGAGAATAAP